MHRLLILLAAVFILAPLSPTQAKNYRYVNEEGMLTFVPKPWMIPVPFQDQLPKGVANPFPVYDYNASYLFQPKAVVGDFQIAFVDSKETLRLYGLHLPKEMEEAFDERAQTKLRDLLSEVSEIFVVFDHTQRNEPGEMLAYAFAGERFINAEILSQGLAITAYPDAEPRFRELMDQAQAYARSIKAGLWQYWTPGSTGKLNPQNMLPNVASRNPVMAEMDKGIYHQVFCRDFSGADPMTEERAHQLGLKPCRKCNLSAQGNKAGVVVLDPGTSQDQISEVLKMVKEKPLTDNTHWKKVLEQKEAIEAKDDE